jgi:hypothetical protein
MSFLRPLSLFLPRDCPLTFCPPLSTMICGASRPSGALADCFPVATVVGVTPPLASTQRIPVSGSQLCNQIFQVPPPPLLRVSTPQFVQGPSTSGDLNQASSLIPTNPNYQEVSQLVHGYLHWWMYVWSTSHGHVSIWSLHVW